jgi:ribose transport system permease protein
VFLRELQQFVLALGVDTSVQTLVQAIALAVGVALYSIDWSAMRQRWFGPGSSPPVPG